MIMKCLFNGYSSLLSRSQLKTLLYGVNKIVDLAVESTKANEPFTMLSANTMMKSETGKKYDGPSITTTTIEHTVIVKHKEKVSQCSANMPSEHLKLSLTHPRISQYLCALPDRTEGVSKNWTTGEKWKSHPLFQPPQMSIRHIDFWTDGINQVDGYFVVKKDDRYMILPELSMVPQGSSKQHIPYESWSMTYAALPLEERGRRENTMFIGCAPKSDGINGVAMFSGEHNETVLVKAPVMFVSADNPAYSDICGIQQQTTLYFGRKSRNHYIFAASDCSRKNVQIVDVLEALNAYDLSFKNTGSQDLLLLNPFDPSQDTPVEALHCLPLGVAKYLIEHLVKITLGGRANEEKMNRLISRLKENECNPSYTKNFRRQLRHVGSFVGRDFKQLIQVLPGIIASEFTDPVNDIKVIQLNRPLQALGKLCSLLFVRQIEAGFEDYVNSIEVSVKELTASLYEFDTVTHNKNAYSTKPKVHYLHHIHQDIRRFGCALQLETEKGEMFNKFIREQLFHTNRLSPSKDVVIRFGSQEILKFIIDGEPWTNKNSKRVRYGSEIKQFVEANESFHSFFEDSRIRKR
ncbi:hypothetical protein G6F64_003333 [Rhizopus arrhizus]|uniref:Uncharacterized protein n=1 Tax=Rhizopus oryzae TaxID=64495 RepID=A0A9P7BV18_RHIOR|nr:hypothetical protein G6F64_003333 [Rhizopus arrhizus]